VRSSTNQEVYNIAEEDQATAIEYLVKFRQKVTTKMSDKFLFMLSSYATV